MSVQRQAISAAIGALIWWSGSGQVQAQLMGGRFDAFPHAAQRAPRQAACQAPQSASQRSTPPLYDSYSLSADRLAVACGGGEDSTFLRDRTGLVATAPQLPLKHCGIGACSDCDVAGHGPVTMAGNCWPNDRRFLVEAPESDAWPRPDLSRQGSWNWPARFSARLSHPVPVMTGTCSGAEESTSRSAERRFTGNKVRRWTAPIGDVRPLPNLRCDNGYCGPYADRMGIAPTTYGPSESP